MRPTPLARCLLVAVAGTLIHAGSAASQSPNPQEVTTLHVLLVMDTSDPNIAKGVRVDLENIKRTLSEHIPKSRHTVTVIDGPAITPDRVLNYFKSLKVQPTDGLLFYYSGHGSMRDGKGHTLELQKGTHPLFRSDLIKAMKAKQAAATIVLTDCCSDRNETPTDFVLQAGKPRGAPTAISPIAKKLFFQPQPKGVVDITAATNDVALSDEVHGGFFTYGLCRTLNKHEQTPIGWKEFHQSVAKATKDVISDYPPAARTSMKAQEPTLLSPLPDAEAVRRAAAVVSFTNPTDSDIEFECRWSASAPWTKKTIPAKGRISLGKWLTAPTAPLPELTVKLDGVETPFAPNRYEKDGIPKFSDGKQYRLGESKGKGRARAFELDPKPDTGKSEEVVPVEESTLPMPPVGSRPMFEPRPEK